MNQEAKITYEKLDPNVRAQYDPAKDKITVDLDVDKAHIPGRLAHEGSHAARAHKDLPYNFADERAAFKAGYEVDSELRLSDAFNPPDAWIRRQYGF